MPTCVLDLAIGIHGSAQNVPNIFVLYEGGGEMSDRKPATFQDVLDMVESLADHQQETLIDILEHRLMEHRREMLAQNVREARAEYGRGETREGTVDDLMREIAE
jgi:hypothetical protein